MPIKNKYSAFTKEELCEFLQNYERSFLCVETPFRIMANKRLDEIHKRICEHNKKTKNIESQLDFVLHHEKWLKLNKEYDKWEKLTFGESEVQK